MTADFTLECQNCGQKLAVLTHSVNRQLFLAEDHHCPMTCPCGPDEPVAGTAENKQEVQVESPLPSMTRCSHGFITIYDSDLLRLRHKVEGEPVCSDPAIDPTTFGNQAGRDD